MEIQIVFLNANLEVVDKGLVYPYDQLAKAKAEVAKINRLLEKQLVRSFKAYIMEGGK